MRIGAILGRAERARRCSLRSFSSPVWRCHARRRWRGGTATGPTGPRSRSTPARPAPPSPSRSAGRRCCIRLHSGNFDFADAKEDGSDLRFVAGDDKTPLKFHIESFDGLIDQVGLIWVDVPDLTPGAATFDLAVLRQRQGVAGDKTPRAPTTPIRCWSTTSPRPTGRPSTRAQYANTALEPGRARRRRADRQGPRPDRG